MNKCRAYALRCMKEYIEIKVSEVFYFKNKLFTLKNYEKRSKYGHFHFLGLPRVFFQATAPKLVQTHIFWVYWAKKKVASSIRYGDHFSYWATEPGPPA